jgi:hypothetical protein
LIMSEPYANRPVLIGAYVGGILPYKPGAAG